MIWPEEDLHEPRLRVQADRLDRGVAEEELGRRSQEWGDL